MFNATEIKLSTKTGVYQENGNYDDVEVSLKFIYFSYTSESRFLVFRTFYT